MLKKKLSFALIVTAAAAVLAGCVDDADVTGYWELTFINKLEIGAIGAENLCNAGGKVTMKLNDSNVQQNFKYTSGAYGYKYAQPGVKARLTFGDKTQNNHITAEGDQYINCSDLAVKVYNRRWAGAIFGIDEQYGTVTTDPSGACIITASKSYDYDVVGVTVELKNELNYKTLSDGTQVNDYANNYGYFEWDCKRGNYSNGRVSGGIPANQMDVNVLREALKNVKALN